MEGAEPSGKCSTIHNQGEEFSPLGCLALNFSDEIPGGVRELKAPCALAGPSTWALKSRSTVMRPRKLRARRECTPKPEGTSARVFLQLQEKAC